MASPNRRARRDLGSVSGRDVKSMLGDEFTQSWSVWATCHSLSCTKGLSDRADLRQSILLAASDAVAAPRGARGADAAACAEPSSSRRRECDQTTRRTALRSR